MYHSFAFGALLVIIVLYLRTALSFVPKPAVFLVADFLCPDSPGKENGPHAKRDSWGARFFTLVPSVWNFFLCVFYLMPPPSLDRTRNRGLGYLVFCHRVEIYIFLSPLTRQAFSMRRGLSEPYGNRRGEIQEALL